MQFQIERGGNEPRNRQMSFVAQTDLTLAAALGSSAPFFIALNPSNVFRYRRPCIPSILFAGSSREIHPEAQETVENVLYCVITDALRNWLSYGKKQKKKEKTKKKKEKKKKTSRPRRREKNILLFIIGEILHCFLFFIFI